MAEPNGSRRLVVIGDQVNPKPYLLNLLALLKEHNSVLSSEQQVSYLVCGDSCEVALSLREHREAVRCVLLGPGLEGKPLAIARLLSRRAQIVLVTDDSIERTISKDRDKVARVRSDLEAIGVVVAHADEVTESFYRPVVDDHVIKGVSPPSFEDLSPEERAAIVDRRLESVNKFPAMPETQRRIDELDDMAPPKKWAEAIDPDVTIRAVVLRLLNSAHYGFRSSVDTIDQAVARAGVKAIRGIVLACSIRELFDKVPQARVEQFWKHSIATGLFARTFALPADGAEQDARQKSEFEALGFDDSQKGVLRDEGLWKGFDLAAAEDPFVGGLLHDIGKMTMILCFEESLLLIDALVQEDLKASDNGGGQAQSSLAYERSLMQDLDHQVIGGRIAERWGLEPWMQTVITTHHDVDDGSSDLLRLTALSNVAAGTLFPYPLKESQHPLARVFKRLKVAVRKVKTGDPAEIVVENVIREEFLETLQDVVGGLDVPESIWKNVDMARFFRICFLLAPRIASLTTGFIQQTKS